MKCPDCLEDLKSKLIEIDPCEWPPEMILAGDTQILECLNEHCPTKRGRIWITEDEQRNA